jgi:hypothetical protein
MIDLLLLLLAPALRYVEDKETPWWRLDLAVIAILAWVVDIIIAHTTWAAAFGWPKPYELTISHTLERLCKEKEHPDYELFIQLAKKINRVSPTHDHIRAVLP